MSQKPDSSPQSQPHEKPKKKRGPVKTFIRDVGRKISRSPTTTRIAVSVLKAYFALVARTSPHKRHPDPMYPGADAENTVICTFWHGLHFMGPYGMPRRGEVSVLVSRSVDGEVNAKFLQSFGVTTIRGSGGRVPDRTGEKGALAALVAMSKALKSGSHVGMTADIPKGVSRRCGLGVITLAKISGKPIVPVTYASSRRHVFQSAWDKAVLPLPFGRSVFMTAPPVFVPRDADEATMEAARQKVEAELNRITQEAFAMVDAKG